MAEGGSNKKVANKLVAASFAAVLSVYVAGYSRTQSAANRLAAQIATERRATSPEPHEAFPIAEFRRVREASAKDPASSKPLKVSPVEIATAPAQVPAAELSPIETPAPPSPEVAVVAPPVIVPSVPTPAPAPAPPPVPVPPTPAWKDGTYTGWGYSRHGNIEAAVVIEGGRIASSTISQCRTRYSCSVIDRIIPQVAQRQGPDVDYVTGATESADAYYGAVVEALSKAK